MKLGIKGQLSVQDIFAVLILLFIYYPWSLIVGTLYDVMLPTIGNSFTTGSVIVLMFQLLPLIVAILIVIYPFLSSQVRRQGGYGGGYAG